MTYWPLWPDWDTADNPYCDRKVMIYSLDGNSCTGSLRNKKVLRNVSINWAITQGCWNELVWKYWMLMEELVFQMTTPKNDSALCKWIKKYGMSTNGMACVSLWCDWDEADNCHFYFTAMRKLRLAHWKGIVGQDFYKKKMFEGIFCESGNHWNLNFFSMYMLSVKEHLCFSHARFEDLPLLFH